MTCDRCGQPSEIGAHGWLNCPLEPRTALLSVIDDEIEGGPRFFDTMGHEPVWIASKSQWRREVKARELVHVDRHDRAYYRRLFKAHDEQLRDTGAAD